MAAAAACEESLSATGQLTEAQFERAMRLFCSWWQRDHPDQTQWYMQSKVLPVTAQVVHYVQLDRVVAAAACSRQAEQPRGTALQPTAAAAGAAADRPACSTQHPRSSAQAHAETGHAAGGEPLGGALRATAAARRPAMQQQDPQQVLVGGAGSTAQTPAAAGSSRRSSSSSSVGSMPDLDELASSCWDEATLLAGDDQQADASCPAQQQQQHLHQYNVVWHEIYQVPVLYLGGCHADGRPLPLAELCQDLPQLAEYEDASLAKWAYLTATAHPVTGGPSFMLHPCQTAARMQLLMQPEGTVACTQAALAAGDASPSSRTAAAAVAEAAVTPASHPGRPRQHTSSASGVAGHTARPELLVYAQGWFSMIVPLLGLSLLGCS